ncbi:cytochrome P450 [Tanacetum coccineum]
MKYTWRIASETLKIASRDAFDLSARNARYCVWRYHNPKRMVGKKYSNRLPPGSLGVPVIGQSLDLLKALKNDKVEEWFHKGIAKNGPIWKANLFGYSTVVVHGPSANKFIYTFDGNVLTSTQPPSISRIMGSKNLFELAGHDHKRVRVALVSFLKLDVLKQYVAKIDEEIQYHLETHWLARKKIVPMLMDRIHEKRDTPDNQKRNLARPDKDLITSFLSISDDSSTVMSEEEIIDNIIIVMIGGYDTTSILISFLVKLLANNKAIYSNIVQEQEEIGKTKARGEALTWEDLTKMKYTWRVASEVLRVTPPVSLSFRRAKQDIEVLKYNNYGGPRNPNAHRTEQLSNTMLARLRLFPKAVKLCTRLECHDQANTADYKLHMQHHLEREQRWTV